MNNLCQFKRGFFTLRTCNRPSQHQCESCQRLSCQFHLSAQTEMRFCVDCAELKDRKQRGDDYYNDDWVYSYRNSYYATGYQPFRFANPDYQSFETFDETGEDWDDDYAGDFTDS